MQLQDSIVKSIESQINAWQHELKEIKAKAKKEIAEADKAKADAEIKHKMAQKAERIERDIKKAQNKIKEVQSAGSDKLQSLKKEVDKWLH